MGDDSVKLGSERFPIEVREQLRGLAEGSDAPLKLLIASRMPLEHLFPDAPGLTSPLSNLCLQLDVPAFSPAESQLLIESRLRGTGISFSAEQLAALQEESRGIPGLLVQAAARLFDRLSK